MRRVIFAIVENEFGVLTRVAGLFSGRGYNIESLSVAPTEDLALSAMTIVTSGDDRTIEQIMKQLNKLINVYKVYDMADTPALERALLLLKVSVNQKNRAEILKGIELFGGKLIDCEQKVALAEFSGDDAHIQGVVQFFKPFGIVEAVKSGTVAIRRGKTGTDEA